MAAHEITNPAEVVDLIDAAIDAGTVTPGVALSDDERQACEVWTRVMGYHRPVSSFNRGKQGEYAERVCFVEPGDVAN